MMRPTPFMALAVVVLAATGCRDEKPALEPVIRPIKSMLVTPAGDQSVSFSGSVKPQVSTDLSFRILGRLLDRDVGVGDTVSTGDTIATLDPSVQEQTVVAARAALVSAQASLANAAGVADRQRALRETGVTAQAVVDQAEQALQSSTSAVEQAQASLGKAEEELGYTRLVAPSPGIVTATMAEAGQVAAAGQAIVTIARPDLRDAVVDLPDRYAAALAVGDPLQVQLQLDPDMTAAGHVREIAPVADPVTRARRVRIALQNPPEGFRLGSIVRVAVSTGSAAAADALYLPDSAVLQADDGNFVWLVSPDESSVSRHAVSVQQTADGRLMVTQGLDPGARIAAAGVHSLEDGQKIRLSEGAP